MVASLILLCVLCTGLAYLWHKRITAFRTMILNIRSTFNGDQFDISQERAYAHCISHQWVLDYVVQRNESKLGNSVRDFLNNRTVLGILILGLSIWPTTAILVLLVYRSFAYFGVSITVFIIAVFLILASDNVTTSYGLLSWLRTQNKSEMKKNDIVYAELSLKTIKNWRMTLFTIAILSLIIAPFGELIPQALALATSGVLVSIFTLVYPPVSLVSHQLAVIVVLYLVPLVLALLYLLFGVINRISTDLKGEILRNL